MSRKLLLLSILILVFVFGVVVGINLNELVIVNIRGVVNIPEQVSLTMSSQAIMEKDIEIIINASHGTIEIDLGEIMIPSRGSIIVTREVTEIEGYFKLLLNGRLDIISNNLSYTVLMPCLASVNESCYRIEIVIPGYDELMEIQPGAYNTKLTLQWVASGHGAFKLRLTMYYTESSNL